MIIATSLVLALTAFAGQDRVTVAPAATDMSEIKDLYASASFEEALNRLTEIEAHAGVEQTEQYRALCLLGLGRTVEAERSLERMVVANPLYVIPASDVSPRLVSMFQDVRKRLLPSAARDLYLEAKTNFDAKRYVPASSQFRELLTLLGDTALVEHAESLGDLRLLGEGFLKLAEGEVATATRAAEQAAAAAAAARAQEAQQRAAAIYSNSDTDVRPPVEIERRMPSWNPPATLPRVEYRGVLEVIINERGQIESAVLRRSVTPSYDSSLIEAVKYWRFQPATHNGTPVKYRKLFEIVLGHR